MTIDRKKIDYRERYIDLVKYTWCAIFNNNNSTSDIYWQLNQGTPMINRSTYTCCVIVKYIFISFSCVSKTNVQYNSDTISYY